MVQYILNETGRKIGLKLIIRTEQEARKLAFKNVYDSGILSLGLRNGFLIDFSIRYDNGNVFCNYIDKDLSLHLHNVSLKPIFQMIPKHVFMQDKDGKQKSIKMTKTLCDTMRTSAEGILLTMFYNTIMEDYKKKHPNKDLHTKVTIFFKQKALRIVNGMIKNLIEENQDLGKLMQIRRFNPAIRKDVYSLFQHNDRVVQLTDSCPYLLFSLIDLPKRHTKLINKAHGHSDDILNKISSGMKLKTILDEYEIPRFVMKINNPQLSWMMFKALQKQVTITNILQEHKGFIPQKHKRRYLKALVLFRDFIILNINDNNMAVDGNHEIYTDYIKWIANQLIYYYSKNENDGLNVPMDIPDIGTTILFPDKQSFWDKLSDIKDWISCCQEADRFDKENTGFRHRRIMEFGCLKRRFNPNMDFKSVYKLSLDWHRDIQALPYISYQEDQELVDFSEPWLPADTFKLVNPLPPPVVADWSKENPIEKMIEEYAILPLLSSLDVIEEGKEMHHCVGSYIDAVIKGNSYLYSIRKIEDESRVATLEIRKNSKIPKGIVAACQTQSCLHDGKIEISQLRGLWNAQVDDNMKNKISTWIAKWEQRAIEDAELRTTIPQGSIRKINEKEKENDKEENGSGQENLERNEKGGQRDCQNNQEINHQFEAIETDCRKDEANLIEGIQGELDDLPF